MEYLLFEGMIVMNLLFVVVEEFGLEGLYEGVVIIGVQCGSIVDWVGMWLGDIICVINQDFVEIIWKLEVIIKMLLWVWCFDIECDGCIFQIVFR